MRRRRVLSGSGRAVLRVTALEYEADLTFGALNQLLRPLLGDLPTLDEVHRQAIAVILSLERFCVDNLRCFVVARLLWSDDHAHMVAPAARSRGPASPAPERDTPVSAQE